MISTIMVCVLIVISFILYSMNMFAPWDLIFIMALVFPIKLYAKSKSYMLHTYLLIQTLAVVARIPVCYFVAIETGNTQAPITIKNPLFLQASGLTMQVGWYVWIICTGVIMLVTCKRNLPKYNTGDEIMGDQAIRHNNSLFNMTVFMVLVLSGFSVVLYELKAYSVNILLNSILMIVATICFWVGQAFNIQLRIRQLENNEKPISNE